MVESEWLTRQQAAERWGCSPEAILQKAIGGRWQKTIGDHTPPGRVDKRRPNGSREGD
jgi:hypothetical protein